MKSYLPPTRLGGLALPLLATALLSSANAASYTLELFSENHPGKYTADPDASLEFVLGNYDVKATSDSGNRFWTFCLERTEYFQNGRIYNATASTQATAGPDPISAGTAYLYEQFATGNLDGLVAGFDYANVANGGARLQNTIWALEGELNPSSMDTDLKNLLINRFGSEAAYLSDYAGASVGVLQLTKFDGQGGDSLGGTARQDQLVYWGSPEPTPPVTTNKVPDGGTTLLLLGLSLGGLGYCKKRIQ